MKLTWIYNSLSLQTSGERGVTGAHVHKRAVKVPGRGHVTAQDITALDHH